MTNLFDKLFMDILESHKEYGLKRQLPNDKESGNYEKFEEALPQELKKPFNDFIEIVMLHECDKAQELFELGFRLGSKFTLEVLNQ